jgi:hypothetical protein
VEAPILARDDDEHPVPLAFRPIFRRLIDAFVAGDWRLERHSIAGVLPIDAATAKAMEANVRDYGDTLAPLDDATWQRSIYSWTGGHWAFLVDLSTANEAVSDLALHAKYREEPGAFEIYLIYVP